MNLNRCENGHFYDVDKFGSCPHCQQSGVDDVVTRPASGFTSDITEPLTVPINPTPTGGSNQEGTSQAQTAPGFGDDSKTISYYPNMMNIEPVVGWLVCINGNYFGESFNLKSGRNFIGRSPAMDISLRDDKGVSRERHAIILYEPRTRRFLVQSGDSRELFYLNDDVVLNTEEIKIHDVLLVGNTKLVFFPCCSEKFSWEDFEEEEDN